MPFTGSHPAAVLPFLRTPLHASALVVGSIAPDIPFYLPLELPWGTHTALAVVTVDVLVGGLAWALWDEFTHPGRWGPEPVPAPARPRWWLPWAVVAVAGLVGGLTAVGGAPDLRSAAVAAAFRGGGVLLATAVVLALARPGRPGTPLVTRPADGAGWRTGAVPVGSAGGRGGVGARAADEGGYPRDVETLLSRTLARYERVLANVADGIYGLDADGRVEFVNPAAVRITGLAAEEQLGRDQHAVIHGRRPDGSPYPKEECPVWRALQTGRTVTADDEVFWHRDGSPVPVELIAVPTVEDGAVTGVVVSFRDLTDRLAARRQAAELRRLTARAEAERALSDRLQRALLTPPPEPDHLQLAVRYRPAAHGAQVGGDWYDAFLQPDGATMLVIGDVVGHDSDAAAAMGQLRGLVRALAYDNDEPPSATLSRAEHVARGLAVSTLATVVLARIERNPDVPVAGTRVLRWSNAGHLPPVLLAPDGTTTLLETRPDLMLGIDPDTRRADHTLELVDGHTLLLVTDGLVERRDTDLDAGLAALQEALRGLGGTPLEELCDTLLARMPPVAGADDVAIVAVRAHPEDRPRPPEAGPNRLPPGFD